MKNQARASARDQETLFQNHATPILNGAIQRKSALHGHRASNNQKAGLSSPRAAPLNGPASSRPISLVTLERNATYANCPKVENPWPEDGLAILTVGKLGKR